MKVRFGLEENLEGITLAGATDGLIARLLLEKHDLPVTPENVTVLLDAYLQALPGRLPRHKGRLLPGIVTLLDQLKTREDCVVALLTGNLVRGAELKLAHYGVWDYFEFGAFADDHHDRNALGGFARTRAEKIHGREFASSDIVVIGDTPQDIECGRVIGARTVAIATGQYSREELLAHGPDHLFADLSETSAVIEALVGGVEKVEILRS